MDSNVSDLRNPDPVCATLGLAGAPDIWRATWARSIGGFVAGDLFFLKPEYVRGTCALLRIGPELSEKLARCAESVTADAGLQRLAWHLHWLASLSGIDAGVGQWPQLAPEAHPANALLYGLVVLAGVPRLLDINRARGIADEVTVETLSDLETWANDYLNWGGIYRLQSLGWLQHHLRGKLFKIVRLEYIPGQYGHPFRWYRNDTSGQVVGLAEDGLLLRPDGQFASADREEVREGLWRTRLSENVDTITGSPVAPQGRILGTTVTLDTNEWREVLRKGDPVMTVHIPSKGSMRSEDCGESFRQAVEFYQRHFPEVVFRAFTCTSWLLDPQFEQFQPAPPNICGFLREWYLHPVEGADDSQAFQRLFDLFGPYGQVRWGEVEAKTSLQRAALDFVEQGRKPRGGGSVLFAEDLDWGKAVYRNERQLDLIQWG